MLVDALDQSPKVTKMQLRDGTETACIENMGLHWTKATGWVSTREFDEYKRRIDKCPHDYAEITIVTVGAGMFEEKFFECRKCNHRIARE